MMRLERAWSALVWAVGFAACLLLLGFLVFAATVEDLASGDVGQGDAIVVLTGGEHRIIRAVRLLVDGNAPRLFISGVHPKTTKSEIQRMVGFGEGVFGCCVELGHLALDTVGNAYEARDWVAARGIGSIIIVTSSYHLPRSMIEMARVMPGVKLIPAAVRPTYARLDHWWRDGVAARLLIIEYIKFLPAAARYLRDRTLTVPEPSPRELAVGAALVAGRPAR